MVPGAMGLVVGGGPLTQYASPTTMFVPVRATSLDGKFVSLGTGTTHIVNYYKETRFALKSDTRSHTVERKFSSGGRTHTSGFHAKKSVNAIEKFVSITVQVSPDLSKRDQMYSLKL